LQNDDLFEGDEAAAKHVLGGVQEIPDLLLAVDDLNDDGEILGEAEHLGGVQAAKQRIEVGKRSYVEVAYVWDDLNQLLP